MGMCATLYALSPDAYRAGIDGNLDAFTPDEHGTHLDKAWHAVHYLVTGDTELRFLTTGTQFSAVSEPCELHSAEAIRELSQSLASTTAAELMRKFDPDVFNTAKVYGAPWDAGAAAYISEYLDAFLTALHSAARSRSGLFVVLL